MRTLKTIRTMTMVGMLSLTLFLTSGFAFAGSPQKTIQPATFGTEEGDLKDYISENLVYPSSLIGSEFNVKVEIKFWVDKFGNVVHASVGLSHAIGSQKDQISKSELNLFKIAALNAVQKMPRWNPATVNGESQPAPHVLPILFKSA